jgi:hypothetical protein
MSLTYILRCVIIFCEFILKERSAMGIIGAIVFLGGITIIAGSATVAPYTAFLLAGVLMGVIVVGAGAAVISLSRNG